MLKRKIDIILSEGHGRQLIWLLLLSLICVGIAVFIANYVFDDHALHWQDVVALFLDPGVFAGVSKKGHDVFRLIIALLSVFLFSALLVSVFTNVFENISESVRNGKRRYHLRNHVVILGSGPRISDIISALNLCGKDIVVMSERKPDVVGKYIYYNGNRTVKDDLLSANVNCADTIYIIGDDAEDGHDAKNLQCLDILNVLCLNAKHEIHCFVTVSDQATTEVFQYLDLKQSSKLLLVDVLNDYEYEAEQLLVDSDTLPVIKKDDNRNQEIVIIGKEEVAHAIAFTCAHICHYPNYITKGKKTRITFIAEDMKHWMDNLIASRPALFQYSVYRYIDPQGTIIDHHPIGKYGDFLDIEWRFVDTYECSSLAKSIIIPLADKSKHLLNVFVCHKDSNKAISSVLHLPEDVYGRDKENVGAFNIAVFMRENASLIDRANSSHMYGKLTVFGGSHLPKSDPLLSKRSKYGQRVNYVYNKAFCNPPSPNEEAAWYKIKEAHKYSSIYCANAMFLRRKCFDMDGDRQPIYEAEHRRWMMSVLIMGYKPGENTDKRYFIHADIIPFDALSKKEQEKDKIIIDELEYILE